jgi:hypothetical protein
LAAHILGSIDTPVNTVIKSNVRVPADMVEAIERCHQRCEAIVNDFAREMDAQPAPSTIYHYTNSAGLLGILESGNVRLTNMFGLNDPSELRHGVSHACEILTREAQDGHPAAKIFAQNFSALKDQGVEASAHFFVACFSRDGDDLGQWRAYGDNGQGFAIGFDGGLLEQAFVKHTDGHVSGNATFPVTYNDVVLQSLQQKMVKEAIPLIAMPAGRSLSNAAINEFMKELSVHLSVPVIRAAIFFKHEAYKNEQEYRFLQIRGIDQTTDDLKRWARRHSLIRFAEFDWKTKDQSALREIIVGPAADESVARSFARECLRVGGFDPERVVVRPSRIPYRST